MIMTTQLRSPLTAAALPKLGSGLFDVCRPSGTGMDGACGLSGQSLHQPATTPLGMGKDHTAILPWADSGKGGLGGFAALYGTILPAVSGSDDVNLNLGSDRNPEARTIEDRCWSQGRV